MGPGRHARRLHWWYLWGTSQPGGNLCEVKLPVQSNPSLADRENSCVFRKFPWRKFPVYLVAQVLGAMCASGVVYANYKSAIDVFEGGTGIRTVPGFSTNATAGIFCTYPQPCMSPPPSASLSSPANILSQS